MNKDTASVFYRTSQLIATTSTSIKRVALTQIHRNLVARLGLFLTLSFFFLLIINQTLVNIGSLFNIVIPYLHFIKDCEL
jgi:hypothetical protein